MLYIFRVVIGVLIGIYICLLIGVNLDACQQWLARRVSASLTEYVKAPVQISKVSIGLFNRVTLYNVRLIDPDRCDVLKSKYVEGKIELWPLLREGKIRLNTIAVLDAEIKVARKENGQLNIQYLIDAFTSKDDSEEAKLNLTADVVIVRRSVLAYSDAVSPALSTSVSDLDLNLSLYHLSNDSLSLRLRRCGFCMDNGEQLRNIKMQLDLNRSGLCLQHLEMHTKHASLSIPALRAKYDYPAGASLLDALTTVSVDPFTIKANSPALNLLCKAHVDDCKAVVEALTLTDNHGLLNVDVDGRIGYATMPDSTGASQLVLAQSTLNLHEFKASAEALDEVLPHLADVSPLLKKYWSVPQIPDSVRIIADNVGSLEIKGTVAMQDARSGKAILTAATPVGQLDLNAELTSNAIAGRVQVKDLQPAKILGRPEIPAKTTFDLNGRMALDGQNIQAKLTMPYLEWQNYTYTGISLDGALHADRLKLLLNVDDTNVKAMVDAAANKALTDITLKAKLDNWRLFLPENIQAVAGEVETELHNVKSNVPTGYVNLQNLAINMHEADSVSVLRLRNMNIASVGSTEGVCINFNSDFARGNFRGLLDIDALQEALKDIANSSFSNLLADKSSADKPARAFAASNFKRQWNVAMNVSNTDFLSRLFKLPFAVKQPLTLSGLLDADSRYASVQMQADSIEAAGIGMRNVRLSLNSDNTQGLGMLLQAQKSMSDNELLFQVDASAHDNQVRTDITWKQKYKQLFQGEIAAVTTLERSSADSYSTHVNFLPTTILINDTLWNISGGQVDIAKGMVDIHSLSLANKANQSLVVAGRYSNSPQDSIVANLRNINLKYILDMVDFDDVILDGLATGKAVLSMENNNLNAHANLTLPHIYFNDTDMGEAHILANFNSDNKRILLDATIGDDRKQELAHGYVDVDDKTLDLNFTAQHTPISFLNFFTEDILEQIHGEGTGTFRLYGPLKKLDFGGNVVVRNGGLIVPVTGVRYNIDEVNVKFTPGLIEFNDGKFADGQNGSGIIHGAIRHDNIKNIRYNIAANFYDALIYDVPKQMDSNFYATARGSGSMNLKGGPGNLWLDVDMTPSAGTDFTYINDTPEAVVNGGYLRFHSKNEAAEQGDDAPLQAAEAPVRDAKSDIYLNFNINLTPDAALHVVMDEKTGDVINLYGRGNISANYYNKGEFLMYGVCSVDHGVYRFSIQDVIRKNFRLVEGGTVTFAGAPMDADLDVQAYYTVNSASLSDLNAGTTFSDNKVRVNCLLNINGKANSPQLTFDLDLPNVNGDEKQMVRKLIATEEDMNMQILYLLGVGRFYTYDAASRTVDGNTLAATNSVNSFISSTISSQLNEIFENALRSNNWSFGTNLATGQQGWNDIEVEALLSGRLLNNRLLINGQFGYRDRATHPTANNFIGDFDIQYLLTRSGNYRLKAYNETNDRYFTKSALMTQGIGFMFQKDFDSFIDKRRRLKLKTQQEKKD